MLMRKVRSSQYQAYLLRLWKDGDSQDWRALLVDVRSNDQQGFASLEALFEHLRKLTDPGTQARADDNPILFKGEGK
ncbi:MAG: hypothetical protein L6461_15850 [Anaerolineae bacterium]|nr:hypothetical protein [Anaerolineae bacterium]